MTENKLQFNKNHLWQAYFFRSWYKEIKSDQPLKRSKQTVKTESMQSSVKARRRNVCPKCLCIPRNQTWRELKIWYNMKSTVQIHSNNYLQQLVNNKDFYLQYWKLTDLHFLVLQMSRKEFQLRVTTKPSILLKSLINRATVTQRKYHSILTMYPRIQGIQFRRLAILSLFKLIQYPRETQPL